MVHVILLTIISVILVSSVSLIGVISLSLHRKFLDRILLLLVSLSAGTLLGGAFLHLIPEAAENGFTLQISSLIILGVISFFILEKFIHWHRCRDTHLHDEHHPLQHIGILNLAGDGVHNLIDGLVIAGSYLVSLPVGIATTFAVIIHEIPQELADFGVLVYSGFSKKNAILLNLLSAAIAILGAIIGLSFVSHRQTFIYFILPFAAGGFIYIAGSNLIPEIHKESHLRESIWHVLAMLAGIVLMYGVRFID